MTGVVHERRLSRDGHVVLRVVHVHHGQRAELLGAVRAARGERGFAGGLEGRQEHGGEDADDRHHDQKFDQGEPAVSRTGFCSGSEAGRNIVLSHGAAPAWCDYGF